MMRKSFSQANDSDQTLIILPILMRVNVSPGAQFSLLPLEGGIRAVSWSGQRPPRLHDCKASI